MVKWRQWTALLLVLLLVLSGCSGNLSAQEGEVVHLNDFTLEEEPQEEEHQEEEPQEEQEEQTGESETEAQQPPADLPEPGDGDEEELPESGTYTAKADVARYIYLYGHLPDNYITKREAKRLGWVSSEGNLGQVAPGKSIGGDRFGNYEGRLPEAADRVYWECDIDFDGTYRGAKRIVFSNDGLIYYTEDHYQHFELLYGEE